MVLLPVVVRLVPLALVAVALVMVDERVVVTVEVSVVVYNPRQMKR